MRPLTASRTAVYPQMVIRPNIKACWRRFLAVVKRHAGMDIRQNGKCSKRRCLKFENTFHEMFICSFISQCTPQLISRKHTSHQPHYSPLPTSQLVPSLSNQICSKDSLVIFIIISNENKTTRLIQHGELRHSLLAIPNRASSSNGLHVYYQSATRLATVN